MSNAESTTFQRSSPWYRVTATVIVPQPDITTIGNATNRITGAFFGASGIDSTGTITLSAGAAIAGAADVTVAAIGAYLWSGRGRINAPSDGVFTLLDAATTSFTRLNFGGTTSAFPALVRSGANITLQLADGTDGGVFNLPMGTGTGEAPAVGTANVNTTAVGNVGVGTDDLMTYSHPANSLSADGKGVHIRAWGTSANNANLKTVTLAYGGTTLVSTALTVSQVGVWCIDADVIRTGATAQEAVATLVQGGTATIVDVERTTPAETLSGAVTIKCTGNATADNDIVQEGLRVTMIN